MTKRKIAVFTGNRAEYGLLYPVLKKLDESNEFDLKLIVSGAHLDPNFGKTIQHIENDNFKIAAEIKIPFSMDHLSSTSKAIGSAILSLTEALDTIKPDIFVVYADRFEGFAATITASQMALPTAHIEGGDITEGGAFDDSVRHAMTKLAHIHFTTNQQAANRIIGMGEEPWRVHNVGFTGIDLIKRGRVTSKEEISKNYNLDLTKPIVLFTQHAVGVEYDQSQHNIEQSLKALYSLADENVQIILTYPNNDVGSTTIIDTITKWTSTKPHHNIHIYKSLGQQNYYGMLSLALDPNICIACVGNSSSGIKETPAFFCPTVNIGNRQNGRLRAANVLDCGYNTENILQKIKTALFDKKFRKICQHVENPYGTGDSAEKIAKVLATIALDAKLLTKKMTLKGITQGEWHK